MYIHHIYSEHTSKHPVYALKQPITQVSNSLVHLALTSSVDWTVKVRNNLLTPINNLLTPHVPFNAWKEKNEPQSMIQTVLILCPKNVIRNWVSEFKKWQSKLDHGNRVSGVCDPIIVLLYPLIHPLYACIIIFTPLYTFYRCIYTIYTPNTPLNTLYTP